MADIQKITESVKAIIVKQLAVNADQVTPEARFIEDLNADSLDVVEITMILEKEFGITIADEEMQGFITVGDAIESVKKHVE